MTDQDCDLLRQKMVTEQIERRGIRDVRVVEAMRTVPRHLFVPEQYLQDAYADKPLPIGYHQTISQPYIVALMLEALVLRGTERVLEIGTGSGYQAALLSRLAAQVFTVEVIPELAAAAQAVLARLGCRNVTVCVANGSLGWPTHAPYDAIIVAAASPIVPPSLLGQLADGGRLVLPVGDRYNQTLLRVRKQNGRVTTENLGACSFVPLVGEQGWKTRTLPT